MKVLLLDIETAPHKVYCWGLWAQDIHISSIIEPGYTLCWAAKWLGKSKIEFDSIKKSGAKRMIKRIHALLQEADAVVHYNGSAFDIPTLRNEFLLHGLPPPAGFQEIDLLKSVRKQFRFPSNKLDYVSQRLDLGSKLKHKGMELWKDCMAGNDSAWHTMERYNKQDVKLLEPLYERLLPWLKGHPNVALYSDEERPQCPHCGSGHVVRKGHEYTRAGKYPRFRCQDCLTPIRGRTQETTPAKRKSVLAEAA